MNRKSPDHAHGATHDAIETYRLAAEAEAPRDRSGEWGCPGCGARHTAADVICVGCGFDSRTGSKIHAESDGPRRTEAVGTAAPATQIADEPLAEYDPDVPGWLLIVAPIGGLAVVIATVIMIEVNQAKGLEAVELLRRNAAIGSVIFLLAIPLALALLRGNSREHFGCGRLSVRLALPLIPACVVWTLLLVQLAAGPEAIWPTPKNHVAGIRLPSAPIISLVLIAPLCEEFFFRGLMFRKVWFAFANGPAELSRFAPAIGAGVSAVVFTILHWDWHGVLVYLCVGLALAATVWLTGTIWYAILIHALFNATAVASVNDAEGTMMPLAHFHPVTLLLAIIGAVLCVAWVWWAREYGRSGRVGLAG